MNYYKVNWTKKRKQEYELKQKGICSICHMKARLVMDHSHSTGCPRELLCHACNIMLGNAQDDVAILERAMGYLEKHGRPCGEQACRACHPDGHKTEVSDMEIRAGIARTLNGRQLTSADAIAKYGKLPRARVRKMVTRLLANGDMLRGGNGCLAFVGDVDG